jgi:hypothetical protein
VTTTRTTGFRLQHLQPPYSIAAPWSTHSASPLNRWASWGPPEGGSPAQHAQMPSQADGVGQRICSKEDTRGKALIIDASTSWTAKPRTPHLIGTIMRTAPRTRMMKSRQSRVVRGDRVSGPFSSKNGAWEQTVEKRRKGTTASHQKALCTHRMHSR